MRWVTQLAAAAHAPLTAAALPKYVDGGFNDGGTIKAIQPTAPRGR